LRRLLSELEPQPCIELCQARHVVGAACLPRHRAEQGLRDSRPVEPFEKRRQAGQRDDQLGDGAGAHERLDRRAEEAQRRLQLAVRGVHQGGVTGQETLEEPHVVLAEVGHRLVPGLQGALGVHLGVDQPDDPQGVGEPVGVVELTRGRQRRLRELHRLLDAPADWRPSA